MTVEQLRELPEIEVHHEDAVGEGVLTRGAAPVGDRAFIDATGLAHNRPPKGAHAVIALSTPSS